MEEGPGGLGSGRNMRDFPRIKKKIESPLKLKVHS